jgi:hypothetical protein
MKYFLYSCEVPSSNISAIVVGLCNDWQLRCIMIYKNGRVSCFKDLQLSVPDNRSRYYVRTEITKNKFESLWNLYK